MIETAQAVANVEAIAATPGIDALFVGTSDLTADMGIAGQIGHARVVEAYEAVVEACQKHGKCAGVGGVYDDDMGRPLPAHGRPIHPRRHRRPVPVLGRQEAVRLPVGDMQGQGFAPQPPALSYFPDRKRTNPPRPRRDSSAPTEHGGAAPRQSNRPGATARVTSRPSLAVDNEGAHGGGDIGGRQFGLAQGRHHDVLHRPADGADGGGGAEAPAGARPAAPAGRRRPAAACRAPPRQMPAKIDAGRVTRHRAVADDQRCPAGWCCRRLEITSP